MPANVDVVPESTYTANGHKEARGLWVGLLAAPVLYALYFIVGYLFTEATCEQNLLILRSAHIGSEQIASLIGIFSGVVMIATLFIAAVSFWRWRTYGERDDDIGEAFAFLAFGAFLLSVLFSLLVLVTGIAVFFVDPCLWV